MILLQQHISIYGFVYITSQIISYIQFMLSNIFIESIYLLWYIL